VTAPSIVNHIVAAPPLSRHRLTVHRLDGEVSLDLAELYAAAGRLAVQLRRLGVGPGDRIGIHSANRLEWVLLDLAALRLGAVTAGLEPEKFPAEPELLRRYRMKLLFTEAPAVGAGIVPIDEAAKLAEVPGDGPEPVTYTPTDVTTLKFTSGSTGQPKGLGATVGSIDSSLWAVQRMFDHRPGDHLFVFLPLSLLQQRYWIYSALRFGHDVTVSTYEAAFAALRQARPTVVMGVPGFFSTARRQIEARARRSGSTVDVVAREVFGDRIRYLWTGSAPATVDTLRFFTDAGLAIFEGYGLNETCIVTKNHPGAHRLGSVGQVLPGKEVLLDADGVIRVRADHPVNTRYEYAAPGDSERVFGPDGTVLTGDLGYFDEDGFLYIRGRADDVIVLGNGRKVIVRPIEERLRAHPAVDDCVLFCPSERHLVAVVSPAGAPADEVAIAEHVAAVNAAGHADERIHRVVVADEPFTVANNQLSSQFKPRRQQILARYRDAIHDSQRGIHAR